MEVRRVLEGLGYTVTNKSGGSHWIASKAGQGSYPISAHNGGKSDVDQCYIDGLCRCFGLDVDMFSGDRRRAKKAIKSARETTRDE